MTLRNRISLVVALAGCTFGLATMNASAATPPADAHSFAVHYSDLDVASPQGAMQLYRRIAFAATQVCPDNGVRDLTEVAKMRACRSQAIAHAVQEVRSPQLAAVSATQGKHG
ncbi:MAG TPA: UrcA family protein [Steroidobacteraceae bacterium]|nr:UrcA family protein [Steroidobacteraceae bacterium]